MADKVAIVTLVTMPDWQQLAELTLPSQRRYAERLGAAFVVIDKQIHAHPHYDKWQIYDLFGQYDRILYLDADILVRRDCPDLFVMIPPEFVAGENELLSFPKQAQHLERFCQQLGIGPLPCPYYLNAGMFLASKCHRQLFRAPEAVLADLPWPEQNHFNARLIGEKIPVFFLPRAFNDRHRPGDYLRRSFMLHYASMPIPARIEAIKRDQDAWERLFNRESPNRPALSGSAQIHPGVPDHDYVSPGLERTSCDRFFPQLMIGDKTGCAWPHLRRQIPHHWYVDRRSPTVGFLNRDEVHLLYNSALQFRGKKALEIGCWLGWSTCHLALAGVKLDVVDPILQQQPFCASLAASMEAAGVRENVNLVAGASPGMVHQLAQSQGRWSFFFIDGNHDAPHPLEDTMACEIYASEDAMILFHDLVCPAVGEGLDYLRQKGWHTRVYSTMQIMGVAWRGNVHPVEHLPDPEVVWPVPGHLQSYVA